MSRYLRTLFTLAFVQLLAVFVAAQDHYPRNWQTDVEHYRFELTLSDETDEISGIAYVYVRFNGAMDHFSLDLTGKNGAKGMTVEQVAEWLPDENETTDFNYTHSGDRLDIQLPKPTANGDRIIFRIRYKGIPDDGLIIDANKYGDRTFFGDNWPNRAHHWLPCVDHPSDKATVDFVVTAPDHYQVIANGYQVEESNLREGIKLTHWQENTPIATKVMVIGAARFAVQHAGWVENTAVTSWIYPQDREKGFYDYEEAVKPLDFFVHHIGPYSYEKLANVQSKTRYGGMENAGNIFYYENSVTGNRGIESLLAHEIAHQWFGNSVSEKDWYHVWLSEGFATYFTNLYLEHTYGFDRLKEQMKADRETAFRFESRKMAPIVDTTVRDYNRLLTPNVYQRGGWVLHMLRREMGDEAFWEGIRKYYRQYRNSNALTSDFRAVMETCTIKDLGPFFQQWLYTAGHPKVSVTWTYDEAQKAIKLKLVQNGKMAFHFPLDIGFQDVDHNRTGTETIRVDQSSQEFTIPAAEKPARLVLDPDVWLLFEGIIEELRN